MSEHSIRLSVLTRSLIEDSYNKILNLSENLVEKKDEDRKSALIKYFKKTMIQFTRLLVLIQWSSRLPSLQKAQALISALEERDVLFRETSQALGEAVNAAQVLKVPLYDIPTSIDVLTTGTYSRLPSILEKTHVLLGLPPPKPKIDPSEIATTKARLDELMRLRLMWSKIPVNFEVPEIVDGKVILKVCDEFEATLTLLDGLTQTSPWTLISLKYLISPDPSYGSNYVTTDLNRRVELLCNLAIKNDPKDPLNALYEVAHTFGQNLQLEILYSQIEIDKQKASEAQNPSNPASNQNQSQSTPSSSSSTSTSSLNQKKSNSILVQNAVYVPGSFLEIFFAGFKLKFIANTTSNQSKIRSSHQNEQTESDHQSKTKKSSRRTPQVRGVTLSLKSKRIKDTRIIVQSFPTIIDPLTGDLAVYEVDPTNIDLEPIVSRAKRLYDYERLLSLYDALQNYIIASSHAVDSLIELYGSTDLIEEEKTDFSSSVSKDSSMASTDSLPIPTNYSLLNLTKDDIKIHICRDMIKSSITIRLFNSFSVSIQISPIDGKPALNQSIGLSQQQKEFIEDKLSNFEVDKNVKEALQELQKRAVLFAFSKICLSTQLQPQTIYQEQKNQHQMSQIISKQPIRQQKTGVFGYSNQTTSQQRQTSSSYTSYDPNNQIPSSELSESFLKDFGMFCLICNFFNEPTMAQSKLVIALDHPKLKKIDHVSNNSGYFTSLSSSKQILLRNSNLIPSGSNHTSGLSTPNKPSNNINNTSLSMEEQNEESILGPLRIRFFLIASEPLNQYNGSKHAIQLDFPITSSTHKFFGFQNDQFDLSESILNHHQESHQSSHNNMKGDHQSSKDTLNQDLDNLSTRRGQKRSFSDSSFVEDFESSETHSFKRSKMHESDDNEADHELNHSDSTANVKRTDQIDFCVDFHLVPNHPHSIISRCCAFLSDRNRSMDWHEILGELVEACKVQVTKILLLENLAKNQASYKPYGTVDTPNNTNKSSECYLIEGYKAPPMSINQVTLTIEADHWFVTLTESQSLIPSGLSVDPVLFKNGSSIVYHNKEKKWIFKYQRATNFESFLNDLRGLSILHELIVQFNNLKKAHQSQTMMATTTTTTTTTTSSTNNDIMSVDPYTSHSSHSSYLLNANSQDYNYGSVLDMNFFKIVAFSANSITIAYGEDLSSLMTETSQNQNQQSNQQQQQQQSNQNQQQSNHQNSSDHISPHEHPTRRSSSRPSHSLHLVHIQWKPNLINSSSPSQKYRLFASFEPFPHLQSCFINSFLETWYSEPSLHFLLELIWNVHPIVSNFNDYWEKLKGFSYSSPDMYLVPQSVAKIRLLFRSWAIDLRFLGNQFVCIDEFKRIVDESPILSNFIPFLESSLQRICDGENNYYDHNQFGMDDQQQHNLQISLSSMESRHYGHSGPSSIFSDHHSQTYSNASVDQAQAAHSALLKKRGKYHVGTTFVVMKVSLFAPLLPLLHAYLGSHRLFGAIEKESATKKQLNENGDYFITFKNTHPDYDVNLSLTKPLFLLDISFPSQIAQDEAEVLSNLLKLKVVRPPYRTSNLRDYLAIFQLPPIHLRDFIAFLRFARDRTGIMVDLKFPTHEQAHALQVFSPNAANAASSGVNTNSSDYRICLYISFLNQGEEISMLLTYHYGTMRISSDEESTNEFLSRTSSKDGKSLKDRSFGSLSGAIESVCKVLQVSWIQEFAAFNRKTNLAPSTSSGSTTQTNPATSQTTMQSRVNYQTSTRV